jgi:hypothetical protein
MVARWLHWAEQVGESTEGNFFERMEGLVLVDEIDLHLHPSWQRRIIPKLKEVFPRLSFVVTTHNPMTLLGVEAHEILVLQESTDGSNRLEAREFDLPPGIRMDQVLTGEWFGLAYAVDDETFRLVEQHQGMLREGVDRDDPARRALEETLARRYGSYADTSLDRMALDVAADLMRDRQPKTANDRAELQRKLVERVKAKLADRERSEAKS